jgi:UDPglucose 6-dehydrogenase
LLKTGKEHGIDLHVVDAVDRANQRQKKLLGQRIAQHFGGELKHKRIAVWGLAFKPETDDIREAPALTLIADLRAAGAQVVAYDPVAVSSTRALLRDAIEYADDMYQAARGADAIAVVTEWREFRRPDFDRLKASMRTAVLFDGRNVWNPRELRELGFTYYGIGRPQR